MKDEFPDRRDADRYDGSGLIGLHKLAEQTGDGMVPELYQMAREREAARAERGPGAGNVVAFTPRDEDDAPSLRKGETKGEMGRVIAFRR